MKSLQGTADGASALDVTSEFNTIVQNTDLTFTSVSWEQPSADNYVLTLDAGSMGYIKFNVVFSSDDYSGYIYGAFASEDSVQGTSGSRIFSTNFSYTDSSDDLKYDTRSAYSATKSVSDVSGNENDFFDSTSKFFKTEAYWTMDMKRIVSNVNGTNGLGKMFYAWQAGRMIMNLKMMMSVMTVHGFSMQRLLMIKAPSKAMRGLVMDKTGIVVTLMVDQAVRLRLMGKLTE